MVAKLACFLHLQPPGLCVGVQRLEVPLRARLQAVESGEAATNWIFVVPAADPCLLRLYCVYGAVLAPMLGAGRGGCGYRSNLYIPTYS